MSNTTRITALESDVAEIKGMLTVLVTRFVTEPVAEPTRKGKKGKKGKEAKKARKPEGIGFKALQLRLREHKAAGLIVPGVSVREALAAGLMDANGNVTGGAVVVAKVEADKPAKTARKASKRAPEPEYGTAEWIAWARPTDDGAPRRADGSVTPKAEWALRMALAESGTFDAAEIDRVVANA